MTNTAHVTASFFLGAFLALSAPVYATDAGMEFGEDMGIVGEAEPSAQAPAFEASLLQKTITTEPIHAGETVSATFELTHPAGATVTFPEVFTPDRWVLIDAVSEPATGGEGTSTSTWVATFGIYRPGITSLQPFDITITDAAGKSVTVTTEPVQAKVLSIFADATDEPAFEEPRPPIEVWVEDYTLAYLGGAGLFLALLGLIAFVVRRRQMLIPPPPPPPRAPHEVALEKLGALAGDDLVERGEYMIFWVRMSEAVREYMGRNYGFPGTELTTTEMLDVLERVTWPTGLGFADIKGFLRRCDEVKFGGATPGVEESTSTLRRAFSVVELTKPRPPVEGELTAGEEAARTAERPKKDAKPARSQWAPPLAEDRTTEEIEAKRKRRPRSEDEKRRRPRSDRDGEERKRRPRSDKDGERKRRPRSDKRSDERSDKRSDEDRERKRRPRPDQGSEKRSDEDRERRRRPKPKPPEDS